MLSRGGNGVRWELRTERIFSLLKCRRQRAFLNVEVEKVSISSHLPKNRRVTAVLA